MLDPLSSAVMLATSMQAQPGVYALLLGSGVSTGAGIPTGWGVVQNLVRRIAAIEDPDSAEQATDDPEQWWAAHHDGPLGYSSLLEALAPTPAARQGILAGFFEPTDEERAEGHKTPSKAHLAIAELVKRGAVRVIVTTNFDRLMEQALDSIGVAPQVISRPEAVAGMKPLAHAPATIIKLHGDYLDLGSRNTPSELESYPEQWRTLIAQVLDEYGLVISGWSADWDTALVDLLDAAPNRRYPLYWDARSSHGTAAQRLIAARDGHVILANSADDLFSDLASNVATLDQLTEPPLTTAMAVGRLKRYLPNPIHRVELYDLVMDAVDRAGAAVQAQPVTVPKLDAVTFDAMLAGHRDATLPLLHLLATGVWHDRTNEHADLWLDAVQRLLDTSLTPISTATNGLDQLRAYPVILAHYVIGVAAIARHRERLFLRVATEIIGKKQMGSGEPVPAYDLLSPDRIPMTDSLPRWDNTRYIYPRSRILREDTRTAFTDLVPADDAYQRLTWAWEYRLGLLQRTKNTRIYYGDSGGATAWYSTRQDQQPLPCEADFLAQHDRDPDWPWTDLLGGAERQAQVIAEHHRDMEVVFSQSRFG